MDNLHKIIAKERAERLISKITDGQIKVEEAIYQACNYTDYCNGVNALQANFAFTKSFLAEESGTKGGLPGNNIYIDMSVFNKENLKCLNIAEPFIWKECPGLETVFAKVNAYSRKRFLSDLGSVFSDWRLWKDCSFLTSQPCRYKSRFQSILL